VTPASLLMTLARECDRKPVTAIRALIALHECAQELRNIADSTSGVENTVVKWLTRIGALTRTLRDIVQEAGVADLPRVDQPTPSGNDKPADSPLLLSEFREGEETYPGNLCWTTDAKECEVKSQMIELPKCSVTIRLPEHTLRAMLGGVVTCRENAEEGAR
jgi:hypothetical protein